LENQDEEVNPEPYSPVSGVRGQGGPVLGKTLRLQLG
jgi:hypothetical protein